MSFENPRMQRAFDLIEKKDLVQVRVYAEFLLNCKRIASGFYEVNSDVDSVIKEQLSQKVNWDPEQIHISKKEYL